MNDNTCVRFLQKILPRLGMRWSGFRKVRGQVCKRVRRRIAELNLESVAAYEEYLLGHDEEWAMVDRMCRITISRFYRDQGVFSSLAEEVLPALQDRAAARGERNMRCWSVGCASGEEPYTLALLFELQLNKEARGDLRIVATDSDPLLLSRARAACYHSSSLKELPAPLLTRGFQRQGERYCLRPTQVPDQVPGTQSLFGNYVIGIDWF
jgi:chemotaxis protein methyltransferase CheR